ncbi:MAG: CHAT domain-containing protein [Planctomycetota bacterium]
MSLDRNSRRARWTPHRQLALALSEAREILPNAVPESRKMLEQFILRRHMIGNRVKLRSVKRLLPFARCIHLACHAEFDLSHPHRSVLHLPNGHLISAAELIDWPLDGLGLATLSACHSGMTGSIAGEEHFGLVASFLAAGTQAVLASLWQVADDEAIGFMSDFYGQKCNGDYLSAFSEATRNAIANHVSPLFRSGFAFFGRTN